MRRVERGVGRRPFAPLHSERGGQSLCRDDAGLGKGLSKWMTNTLFITAGGTFPAHRRSIACYEFAAVSRNRVRRSISLAQSDDRLPPGSLRLLPSRPEAYRATAQPS